MFHPGATSNCLLVPKLALMVWMVLPAEGTLDCRNESILAEEVTV